MEKERKNGAKIPFGVQIIAAGMLLYAFFDAGIVSSSSGIIGQTTSMSGWIGLNALMFFVVCLFAAWGLWGLKKSGLYLALFYLLDNIMIQGIELNGVLGLFSEIPDAASITETSCILIVLFILPIVYLVLRRKIFA